MTDIDTTILIGMAVSGISGMMEPRAGWFILGMVGAGTIWMSL